MKKLLLKLLLLTAFFPLILTSAQAEKNYSFINYTYSTPKTYDYSKNKASNPREKILFILDLSNSMNERFGAARKIDAALDALRETLQLLPVDAEAGLRVYGHKNGITPLQSCTASVLLSPIAQNNAVSIYAKLGSLSPSGWTPITYSLKQALLYDFPAGDYKKRIILISDGGENCDESPCEYIINLMKIRDDVQIDVIALAINDQNAVNQLKCAALVTSGRFYNADSPSGLKNSLQNSLNLQKEVSGVIIQNPAPAD